MNLIFNKSSIPAKLVFLLFMSPFLLFAQQAQDAASLKAAIEADPKNMELHKSFIGTMGLDNPQLVQQYEHWTGRYPASAVFPFALGSAYSSKYSPKAKPWLLKAVERDPKLAKAWELLSLDANLWGDFKASSEFIGKAAEAEPDNEDYASGYAYSFYKLDYGTYREKSLEVARRFPKSERGAQALYWLAYRNRDTEDRVALYEQLRTNFPLRKFSWTESAMVGYFDLLVSWKPEKALQVALEMRETAPWWKVSYLSAKNLVEAKALLAQDKPYEALALLKGVEWDLPSEFAKYTLALTRFEAAAATGDFETAYQGLIEFYSKNPNDQVKEALLKYGSRLNKNKKQVEEDIWSHLEKGAKPAVEFQLKRYYKPDENVRLKDLRGKVVLITYWFPGCGPCREEFSHFQKVVDKFDKDKLVYLGINISPGEDDFVIPFMKTSGYSFDPLHDFPNQKRGNLPTRGAPTNYLLDTEGRIMFSYFKTGQHNERELELMIETLLKHKAK